MLGKLFGSNARVKILKLFLLHSERKYYIRQLSRDLKLQVNSVRRELENLEKFGLLISSINYEDNTEESENEDNLKKLINGEIVRSEQKVKPKLDKKLTATLAQSKKYYQANKNFILFEEIKALMIKAQVLYEEDFIDKLKKTGSPKLFILTGLFTNNLNHNIPVDIFVVGKINRAKFLKLIKNLEEEIGKELNFTLMDTKEFKYRKDITDIFLYNILDSKKIIIIDELGIS